MLSGLFLGYEMKHLITGETINIQTKDKVIKLIETNELVKSVESLKVVSIGANKYLALCNVDYVDSTSDNEIVEINLSLKNQISTDFQEITEIYFNPI